MASVKIRPTMLTLASHLTDQVHTRVSQTIMPTPNNTLRIRASTNTLLTQGHPQDICAAWTPLQLHPHMNINHNHVTTARTIRTTIQVTTPMLNINNGIRASVSTGLVQSPRAGTQLQLRGNVDTERRVTHRTYHNIL